MYVHTNTWHLWTLSKTKKQNSVNSNLVSVNSTYFPSDGPKEKPYIQIHNMNVDCRVPKTSPCEASAERFIKKQKKKQKYTSNWTSNACCKSFEEQRGSTEFATQLKNETAFDQELGVLTDEHQPLPDMQASAELGQPPGFSPVAMGFWTGTTWSKNTQVFKAKPRKVIGF